jgi:transposase
MDKRSIAVTGEPVRVTSNGRRYFSKAHKDAVIAKCLVPGASLAAVALANGFNANLVRRWVRQRQAREGLAKSPSKLVPVTIETAQPQRLAELSIPQPAGSAGCGSMEMRIGAAELVVRGLVDGEQLSRVLQALLQAR